MALFEQALTILRPTRDRTGEGAALHFMGAIHRDQRRLQAALECFEQALPIHREAGDSAGEAATLNGLGTVYDRLERYEEAIGWYEQALVARRALGDRVGEGSTLDHLGLALRRLGRTEEALARYQEALPILQGAGARDREGGTLSHIGTALAVLGRPEDALAYYERALEIQRDLGDHVGERETLTNMAQVHADMARPEEALTALEQATPTDGGTSEDEAERLFRLALLAQNDGNAREAEALYERALRGFRAAHNQVRERDALGNLGAVHKVLGRPREALKCCEQALLMSRTLADRANEGRVRHTLAGVYVSLGRSQDALDEYERALAVLHETDDPLGEAAALSDMGLVHHRLGLYEESYECYERALALFRRLEMRGAEGGALSNVGIALEGLGRLEEARDSYEKAVAVAREVDDRVRESFALINLGLVCEKTGDLGDAFVHCADGLALCRTIEQPNAEIAALTGMGLALRGLGDARGARAHYLEALAICRSVGDREVEVRALHKLGAVERDMGDLASGRSRFEEAIEIAEDVRGTIVSEEARASFFATVKDLYDDYVLLLVELGERERAVHAAERGKARVFLELLAEAQADVREGVDPSLHAEEQRVLAELSERREELMIARALPGEERDQDVIDDLKRHIQSLTRDLHQLEAQIRASNPRYAALTQLTAWELPEIQERLLDEQIALLEYVLSDRGSLLFCVLKDDFEVFALPPREEIELKVRELRAAVLAGLPRYPHGYELYRELVAPAAQLIEGKDLLICADAALHYLPFALLLTEPPNAEEADGETEPPRPRLRAARGEDDEEDRVLAKVRADLADKPAFAHRRLPYLLHRHALSYAPSATVAGMVAAEARGERSYDGDLAALADPHGLAAGATPIELEAAVRHTGEALDPIPLTADEVWTVADLLAGGALPADRPQRFERDGLVLRTGDAATKAEAEALTSGERRFRFLHVATHGLLDPEKPQFSGLVFTPAGGRDPFWRTFEIFNARIRSELVCLSACETGLGRIVSGEGIVGLTRAFLYAGASSVCVSLWKVAEQSSPPLMQSFYRRILAGEPKAKALQGAQRELVAGRRYAHPFWWAPFVLVGEGLKPPTKREDADVLET